MKWIDKISKYPYIVVTLVIIFVCWLNFYIGYRMGRTDGVQITIAYVCEKVPTEVALKIFADVIPE